MASGEELEKSAGNLLHQLFGPWMAEQGLIWQENVRVRRLKNQFEILDKVKNIVDENGIKIKEVDLKALAPLLEGISLEEEPSLQDMWTDLLLNYLDSGKNLTMTVYPNILKQLSTNEVLVLKHISTAKHQLINTKTERRKGNIQFNDEEIANLLRLALIEEQMVYKIDPKYDEYEAHPERNYSFGMSDFGNNFLKACQR